MYFLVSLKYTTNPSCIRKTNKKRRSKDKNETINKQFPKKCPQGMG